jgi:hypothetical protein
MSKGQSRRSVALSVQHRQEAEVAAAEERERAAAETAAIAAKMARLAMAELAAARAEVEAAAAADAARAAATELKLCTPVAPAALFLPMTTETMSSSWQGRQRGSRQRSGQPCTPRGTVTAVLTSADVSTAELMEIAAFIGGTSLPPRTGTMVTMGSRPLSGTSVPAAGDLPSPRPTTSIGPR